MTSLYKAWSVINDYQGRDQVIIHWFVVGREEPIAPYEQLIIGYGSQYDGIHYDRLYVNELLIGDEVEELNKYLKLKHNTEAYTEEVPMPVERGILSHSLLLISGEPGFYCLADEEGYNLSMSIMGYFEGGEGLITTSLTLEELEMGCTFLREVFEQLGIKAPEIDMQKKTLKTIYEKLDLKVHKERS